MKKRKTKKVKEINEIIIDSGIINTIEGFCNRFNIPSEISSREAFKNRYLNALGSFFAEIHNNERKVITQKIATLLGVQIKIFKETIDLSIDFGDPYNFQQSEIYSILNAKTWDLTQNGVLYNWLMVIEIALSTEISDDYIGLQKLLAEKIVEALKLSGINAISCITPTGYKFYPAGVELFDTKLVIDVLKWLDDYLEAKEKYDSALRQFLQGDRTRHILDDCRLSLELFMKRLLHNKKSLEKQIEEIGKYLEDKNISRELRNMFQKLLDYYCKYNNEHVKHDDTVSESEIEFVIYTTGTFMRLMMTASTITEVT